VLFSIAIKLVKMMYNVVWELKILTDNQLNGMGYCSGMQSESCKLVFCPPSLLNKSSNTRIWWNCIMKIRPRIKYPKRSIPTQIDMTDVLLVLQQYELWFNYVLIHQCMLVKGIHWESISPLVKIPLRDNKYEYNDSKHNWKTFSTTIIM
jgi:hypothetical protein